MSGERSLGPALLLALLAVAVGAAAYVYHARTPDLALEADGLKQSFAPTHGSDGPRAEIRFFVRYDEPHATVEIVGRDKVVVRTLADDTSLRANEPVRYRWSGRDDSGELAAPGRYRLRVILPGQDRDMVFPRRITLDSEPFEAPGEGSG